MTPTDHVSTSKLWPLAVSNNTSGRYNFGVPQMVFFLSPGLSKVQRDRNLHLDVHIRIEKEVAQFKITMDYLVRMHVVASADELNHEESCFRLCKPAPSSQHVH